MPEGRPHRRHRPQLPARPEHRGGPGRGGRPRDGLRQGPRARRDRHPRHARRSRRRRRSRIVRSTLVAAGYFEAVTFSFVSDLLADDFVPPEASKDDAAAAGRRDSPQGGRVAAARASSPACSRPSGATRPPGPPARGSSRSARPSGTTPPAEGRSSAAASASSAATTCARSAASWNRSSPASTATGRCGSSPKTAPASQAAPPAGSSGAAQAVGYLGKVDKAVADKLSLRDLPAAAELELEPLLAGRSSCRSSASRSAGSPPSSATCRWSCPNRSATRRSESVDPRRQPAVDGRAPLRHHLPRQAAGEGDQERDGRRWCSARRSAR